MQNFVEIHIKKKKMNTLVSFVTILSFFFSPFHELPYFEMSK